MHRQDSASLPLRWRRAQFAVSQVFERIAASVAESKQFTQAVFVRAGKEIETLPLRVQEALLRWEELRPKVAAALEARASKAALGKKTSARAERALRVNLTRLAMCFDPVEVMVDKLEERVRGITEFVHTRCTERTIVSMPAKCLRMLCDRALEELKVCATVDRTA